MFWRRKLKLETDSQSTHHTSSEVINPYLNARRTWNENTSTLISQRQTWQVIGILSLLIAFAGVGGIIHIGSQSKFVPYVIEVDKVGSIRAAGPITSTSPVDPRIIHATVAEFIMDSRLVTPDVALQRQSILRIYAKLSANDPAIQKLNEWLNGNPEQTPFKRAATEIVNAEIKAVLPQSPSTWQIDWIENVYDRNGVLTKKPAAMRALVTVYTTEPSSSATDEDMRKNPMGIFIRDFSWSQIV